MSFAEVAAQLAEIGRMCCARGWVLGTSGNFSAVVNRDPLRLAITYFDTTTGPKTAPNSYASIAAALERAPSEVLFMSDIGAELDAALTAGMQTALCVRAPGSAPAGGAHPVIHTFDDLAAVGR